MNISIIIVIFEASANLYRYFVLGKVIVTKYYLICGTSFDMYFNFRFLVC